MLRSSKGFFLLDLLLSLSALLMLSFFLLPLLTELRDQFQHLELENKARQLLYEELQAGLISIPANSKYTSMQNGIEYKINWNDSELTGQKEVCVRIEKSSFLPEIEVCGYLE